MKSQEEIEYDERLKKRILILRDLMEAGKITFAENMKDDLEESFSKARFDENGDPDLSTIDGRIRSLALSAEFFDHRMKMKDFISLHEIQRQYLGYLYENFKDFYNIMVEKDLTPHLVAHHIAYKSNQDISYLNDNIQFLIEDLQKFWESVVESGYIHLEDDLHTVKAVFGGDLFPPSNENIASKCGIYIDTIILPCPFMRSRGLFTIWKKEDRVYYLLKLALNILQYRELALTELTPPIIVIIADKEMIDKFSYDRIRELGEKDTLFHAKKVFGRDFESLEELIKFGSELDSIDKVMDAIKDPKRVLFDTEFKEPLKVQIEQQMKGQSAELMGTNNPGIIVSTLGVGRMGVCNELLLKSLKVHGVPLIDAPTSWEYFKWKLEYDSERAFPDIEFKNLHAVRGLAGLSDTPINWVGKIPPEGLIEIRKNGAIDEIRTIMSAGIDELLKVNELDFMSTSSRVFNNLDEAFKKHQENILDLKRRRKLKIAGKDFGSWIVMGTVEVAAACIGTPLYGLSSLVLNQILDAPKLKDLPKSFDKINEIDKQKSDLRKTPIGLLFKYQK